MISLMDMSRLREITDGDPELESQLFQLYIETADRVISALVLHIEDHSGQWAKLVHELKGASANMHIPTMLSLCREMEKMDEPKLRREKLEELGQAYAPLRAELTAAIQQPQ